MALRRLVTPLMIYRCLNEDREVNPKWLELAGGDTTEDEGDKNDNLLRGVSIFNQNQSNNQSTLTLSEAYKILNLDINKKPSKETVNRAYQKIQKKIHPDVSPETSRLSAIVNEAKEVVLRDLG